MPESMKHILVGLLTLLVGITLVWLGISFSDLENSTVSTAPVDTVQSPFETFRYISSHRDNRVGYESYNFQSSGGKILYADDCKGCEVGDTNIFHSFESPERTRSLFEGSLIVAASQNGVEARPLERYLIQGKQPEKVGQRTALYANGGEGQASIFWIEGNEFWEITSSSLERVREFGKTELFQSIRRGEKMQ